jgi:hypothetical protein
MSQPALQLGNALGQRGQLRPQRRLAVPQRSVLRDQPRVLPVPLRESGTHLTQLRAQRALTGHLCHAQTAKGEVAVIGTRP